MNTGILQKCLDELSKESPRLDYVRGILETLIESQPVLKTVIPAATHPGSLGVVPEDLPPMPDLNKIRAAATKEMI